MGNLIAQSVIERVKQAIADLEGLSVDDQIEAINQIKIALHEISPFQHEPVDCVVWVQAETVEGNEYNPNFVAPPEMKLLQHSIREDGYTQPIVTWQREDNIREVVDGFHRNRVGREVKEIRQRLRGYLPVTTVNEHRTHHNNRVATTIRHNRARGKHQVSAMSEIVRDLARRNWSDERISKELGMDFDEVLRLKQISGLAELFAEREFSEAWGVEFETVNSESAEGQNDN